MINQRSRLAWAPDWLTVRGVLARPGTASAALHAVGLAIRMVFMFVILLWRGPALLGEYGLLVSIEMVTVYLAGFEFHSFTTRRYAQRPSEWRLGLSLASHRQMLLVSVPLVLAVSATAIWALGLHLELLQLAAFAVIVVTGSIVQELVRFIVMARNPLTSIVVSFLRTAAWQPFALLLLLAGGGLTSLLSAWAVSAVASLILAVWVLRSAIRQNHRPRFRYLLNGVSVARNYYMTACASVVQGNLERFVLQSLLGPVAVGIFAFFQTLANALPALIQAAVLNLWLPRLLGEFSNRATKRFQTLRQAVMQALGVSGLMSAGILPGAMVLSILTGHSEYLPMSWMLAALLAGQILQMGTQPIYLAMYGAQHDRALMFISLGLLLCSLLLGIALISAFGVNGAVISQLVSGVVIAISRAVLFRHYLHRNAI